MHRPSALVITGIMLLVVLGLPALYFLASGPAVVLVHESVFSEEAYYATYWPLGILGEKWPFFGRVSLGYKDWNRDTYRWLRYGPRPNFPEVPMGIELPEEES